jgi:hypothetical protein
MNMTNCTGCNEPIDKYPAGSYGGDWYASCEICEWHCEGEERTTIKQGLTLEELVAHKKKLNWLHEDLHNLIYKTQKKYTTTTLDSTDEDGNKVTLMLHQEDDTTWRQRLEELLSTVREMKQALIEEEE